MNYQFEDDASFSEHYEQALIRYINQFTPYKAKKTTEKGYPDIVVSNSKQQYFYIEVKVQRRTFMNVEKILPDSKLKPSETVALNLSDLLRYFELEEQGYGKIFIFWILLNRDCVLAEKSTRYFYRQACDLKNIFEQEGVKRRFRRKSGEGDEVDGKHLGVTVNYHFSLSELIEWEGTFMT